MALVKVTHTFVWMKLGSLVNVSVPSVVGGGSQLCVLSLPAALCCWVALMTSPMNRLVSDCITAYWTLPPMES